MFTLTPDGLTLTELAPGVDLERDVLAQMAFRPRIEAPLRPHGPPPLPPPSQCASLRYSKPMDPNPATSPGWLPFVVGFLRSLVMSDLKVEILPPVATGQDGSFRIEFKSTSPSNERVDSVALVWQTKHRRVVCRRAVNIINGDNGTVMLPTSGPPREVEADVDSWEPPEADRPIEAVLKVKLNRLIRPEWEFPIPTVLAPALGLESETQRIRQLVAKDNEIAGYENQGLRIGDVPYVNAYWRGDKIEFDPSFVLRNTWIDNWTVLDYQGRFSVPRFNNTKYPLTRNLHIPTLNPLSGATLSFPTLWDPDAKARDYLRKRKDKVFTIGISLHLVIRCQRDGDEPVTVQHGTALSLIVHPAPSGTSETGVP